MKIKINNPKSRSVFLDGVFYDTNVPIDVNFTDAMRLGRITPVEMEYEHHVYNPSLFKDEKKFIFVSEIDAVSGWGNVSLNLIKYSSQDYNIGQIGRLMDIKETSVLQASRAPLSPDMAVIIHEQPKSEWMTLPFEKKIAVVPFETTKIPSSWIPRINSCSALIVPCKQNIEAFRESGVRIPIELVHWGIDEKKFYELDRPVRDVFTFGTMGALSKRKGTDVLVEAFQKAFPTEQDVRLVCKTSFNQYFFGSRDKRIRADLSPITHEELMQTFFKEVDCFVFPTRGEGFGLTPLEAMATGIPAIVTGWSGPLEYMNEDVGWLIDYSMVPAKEFSNTVYKEDCGDWAEPSVDDLVRLMRYAYEHQDEVREKGKKAAEHVRQNWLWSKKISMFHEVLEKHL